MNWRVSHILREIESGKNKRLTVSIRTMLETFVQEIRQEFGQQIEEERKIHKECGRNFFYTVSVFECDV
jgi:hypothetical protein